MRYLRNCTAGSGEENHWAEGFMHGMWTSKRASERVCG